MLKPICVALAMVALTASATSQQVVVPEGMFFTHTGLSGLTWRTTPFRFQTVYDSTHFTDQGVRGPISISRLRFRAADGVTNGGGATYAGVTIQLSTCPNDYAALSPTFAANRGPDATTVFFGNVTTRPATGGGPNAYVIDVVLATPFVYDPSLGGDLCIEVDGPAPLPTAGVPNMATSNVLATHHAQRVSAASQTAATGTLSPFASVVLMDFAGPGGFPNWVQARTANVGAGCYGQARSFYESFLAGSAMDLSNTTVTLQPNANLGYDVTRGAATPFFPRGASSLGLTDDSGALITLPPSFGSLPYPGGTSTSLWVCSNGFLWLVPPATPDNDFSPDSGRLVNLNARLAPFWHDLLPNAANNVHYDIDPSGTTVYLTWNDVPSFTSSTARTNLQVALSNNGTVQFRYGAVAGSASPALIGWSPGGGAVDAGSRDLSATSSNAFSTRAPEQAPLTLRASVPVIGGSLTHTLTGIPATATASVRLLSFVQTSPIELGALGASGCQQYVSQQTMVSNLVLGSPTGSASFRIPPSAAYLGAVLYGQAISLVPGVNLLGVVSSNATISTIGN